MFLFVCKFSKFSKFNADPDPIPLGSNLPDPYLIQLDPTVYTQIRISIQIGLKFTEFKHYYINKVQTTSVADLAHLTALG